MSTSNRKIHVYIYLKKKNPKITAISIPFPTVITVPASRSILKFISFCFVFLLVFNFMFLNSVPYVSLYLLLIFRFLCIELSQMED